MFLMYDKDMNKIDFPQGVTPLDIFISSIGKERVTDEVEGSNQTINYGATYKERSIELSIYLKANDTRDYRLLRNEVYAMFQTGDTLYISESHERGKRYLVSVDEQYIPERLNGNMRVATATIVCTKIGLPFAESMGMTQDMRVEESGTTLDPSPSYFEMGAISITSTNWEQGAISQSGAFISRNTSVRTKEYIEVSHDRYNFVLERGKELFIREFDKNKKFVEPVGLTSVNTTRRDYTFQFATNTKFIKIYFNADEPITPEDIGVNLLVSIVEDAEHEFKLSSVDNMWAYGMGLRDDEELQYLHFAKGGEYFNIYNAGNVSVHPFEQELYITINNIRGSFEYFALTNETNGTEFRTTESVGAGNQLDIGRGTIKNNGLHYLRETTKDFIELSPGNNRFKISGAASATISFNFRFYYL